MCGINVRIESDGTNQCMFNEPMCKESDVHSRFVDKLCLILSFYLL